MNTLSRRLGLAGPITVLSFAALMAFPWPAQAGSACCTASAPPPVAPVPASEFRGWTNAYRLQNDRAEAIFVPAIGRLVHFALRQDGASPFRIETSLQGKTPTEGETFFNVGGDWLWPVAQARWPALSANGKDWPPPEALADQAWTCSAWTDAEGTPSVLLTRAYGAPLHIQVSRLFRLESDSAALTVQQRIERTAPSEVPVVLWNVSQIAQAEHVVMPIERRSKFRGGLKALMGRKPHRNQLAICTDAAVYRVGPGTETKLGSDSPRGWIAAAKGTHLILESIVNTAIGTFPDGGCIVEVYSNHGLGYSEIETLSPEVLLAPGTVLENTLRIELGSTETPLAGCPLADAVRTLADN